MDFKINSHLLENGAPRLVDIEIENLDLSNDKEVERAINNIKSMALCLKTISAAKTDENLYDESFSYRKGIAEQVKEFFNNMNKKHFPEENKSTECNKYSFDIKLAKPRIYSSNSLEELEKNILKNSNSESIVVYAAVVIDCKIT